MTSDVPGGLRRLLGWKVRADIRHLRGWLWAWWVLLIVFALLPMVPGDGGEAGGAVRGLVLVAMAVQAALIAALAVQADPSQGSTAWWRTRPVRPRELWLAKVFLLVGVLVVPVGGVTAVSVWLRSGEPWVAVGLALEISWYLTCWVGLAAALAALESRLFHWVKWLLIAWGGMAVWIEVFEHLQVRLRPRGAAPEFLDATQAASALVVMLLVLTLGGWVGWWVTFRSRRRRWGVAMLGLALLSLRPIGAWWNVAFMDAAVPAPSGVHVEPAFHPERGGDVPPEAASGQVVMSAFRVTGLPENNLAFLRGIDATGSTNGAVVGRALIPGRVMLGQSWHPVGASWDSQVWIDRLARLYPPGTRWLQAHRWTGNFAQLPWRDDQGMPVRGVGATMRVDGSMMIDVTELVLRADLPLEVGRSHHRTGPRIVLEDIRWRRDDIVVQFSSRVPAQLLSRRPEAALMMNLPGAGWAHIVVVHHPGTATAHVGFAEGLPGLQPVPGLRTRREQFVIPYPEIRARLAGESRRDWLQGARIQVYALAVRGRLEHAFSDVEVPLRGAADTRRDHLEAGEASRRATLEALHPPTDTTPAGTREFVHRVVAAFPDTENPRDLALVRDKLFAAGPVGIEPLLEHAPFSDLHREAIVLPVLDRWVTGEHRDRLRGALERDPALAGFLDRRGWSSDVVESLTPRLRARQEPLPATALAVLVASGGSPGCADVAWHWTRLKAGQGPVLDALRECPEFDVGPVVEEAWRRARLGLGETADLAVPAAEAGLSGGLRGVLRLWEDARSDTDRAALRRALARLTGRPEDDETLIPWLQGNLGRMVFDQARGQYAIRP